MCIRITKELKSVYENVAKIELSRCIDFEMFLEILSIMGYLNRVYKTDKERGAHMVPQLSQQESYLATLAW